MIVCAHQPNLLPGVSVVTKILASDLFIVCDEFQFTRGGFVNRNRLADGTPLCAPYDRRDTFAPINRVRLAEQPPRWREKTRPHPRTEDPRRPPPTPNSFAGRGGSSPASTSPCSTSYSATC